MDLYTIAGLVGVVTYVAAYGALQLDLVDGNGVRYSVANVVAASLVLISLTSDFNLASAVIQVVWITIGIAGLLIRTVRRKARLQQQEIGPVDVTLVARDPEPVALSRKQAVDVIAARLARNPGVAGARATLNLRPDVVADDGTRSLGLQPDSLVKSA